MPNTEKQMTAMQKAIKLLDGQKEVLYHLDKDGVLLPNEKIHKTNQINSIQMLLSKLLATERQQLIDAIDSASLSTVGLNGEYYYNNTFKTQ